MTINNRKGGILARIGEKFHSEIEKIKIDRIKKEKSVDRISTEKITNMIVRHEGWNKISEDIINLDKEELNKI